MPRTEKGSLVSSTALVTWQLQLITVVHVTTEELHEVWRVIVNHSYLMGIQIRGDEIIDTSSQVVKLF